VAALAVVAVEGEEAAPEVAWAAADAAASVEEDVAWRAPRLGPLRGLRACPPLAAVVDGPAEATVEVATAVERGLRSARGPVAARDPTADSALARSPEEGAPGP
jgi:hypothetical protein